MTEDKKILRGGGTPELNAAALSEDALEKVAGGGYDHPYPGLPGTRSALKTIRCPVCGAEKGSSADAEPCAGCGTAMRPAS